MALSPTESSALATVAAMMVPASPRHGMPGADDPLILADMTRTLGRDEPTLRDALARLDALAGGPLAQAPADRRDAAAAAFRAEGGPLLAVLTRIVLQCYYRDDRVMLALGMEARPPFPKGNDVEPGDWSLLDPVRKRAPLWRAAD